MTAGFDGISGFDGINAVDGISGFNGFDGISGFGGVSGFDDLQPPGSSSCYMRFRTQSKANPHSKLVTWRQSRHPKYQPCYGVLHF